MDVGGFAELLKEGGESALEKAIEREIAHEVDRRIQDCEGSTEQVEEDWRSHLEYAHRLFRVVRERLDALVGCQRWDEPLAVHDIRRAFEDLEDVLTGDPDS